VAVSSEVVTTWATTFRAPGGMTTLTDK